MEKQYNPKAKPCYPHLSSFLIFGTAQLHGARSDAHTSVEGAMSSVLKKNYACPEFTDDFTNGSVKFHMQEFS